MARPKSFPRGFTGNSGRAAGWSGYFATTQPPRATIVTHSHDDFGSRALFDAVAPVLPGLERRPAFVF